MVPIVFHVFGVVGLLFQSCCCRLFVGYNYFQYVFVHSLLWCGLFVGYLCVRPARNAPSSFHIDSSGGLFSFFTACLCLYVSITQLFIVFFWNKPDIFMDKFQLQMLNVLLFIITYKLFTRSQVIKKRVKTKNVSQILQLSARFNSSVTHLS